MANKYFNWQDSLRRFVRFDAARSEDVNDALDEISVAMDGVDADTRRAIKLPVSDADQFINMAPEQRANLVIGFDPNGAIAALPGGGRFAGDWAAGVSYLVSETFRDPATKNIYSTAVAHTSTTIADDLAGGKIRLAINVVDAEAARNAAATSAGIAATQAALATTNGAAQVTLAAQKATLATAQSDAAMGYRNAAGAHATTATDQAGIATTKAVEAAASAVQASKLNLGSKSTQPTLDNQGAALLTGATYYDTNLAKWRVWMGAAWGDGISTIAGVSSINGETGPVTGIATTANITAERSAVATLTNKTINIANNTLTGVQPTLVSGTNIKTLNGESVLGAGNIQVQGFTLAQAHATALSF